MSDHTSHVFLLGFILLLSCFDSLYVISWCHFYTRGEGKHELSKLQYYSYFLFIWCCSISMCYRFEWVRRFADQSNRGTVRGQAQFLVVLSLRCATQREKVSKSWSSQLHWSINVLPVAAILNPCMYHIYHIIMSHWFDWLFLCVYWSTESNNFSAPIVHIQSFPFRFIK